MDIIESQTLDQYERYVESLKKRDLRAYPRIPRFIASVTRLPKQVELNREVRQELSARWNALTPGDRDWYDPLATKIGMQGQGTIPADGWPDTFDPETHARISSYIPGNE